MSRSRDAEIHALPFGDKPYKYFLGQGLHVHVYPNGSKHLRIKYRLNGRENIYTVGEFPEISIANARKVLETVKRQVKSGIDPNAIKREERKQRPKPASQKLFRFELSGSGELTIETPDKLVTLNTEQTRALRGFLIADPLLTRGSDEV